MAASEILLEIILFYMAYILKLFLWISSEHFTVKRSHISMLTWAFRLNVPIAQSSDSHMATADCRMLAAPSAQACDLSGSPEAAAGPV